MPFSRIWACVAVLAACLLGYALLFRLSPAEAQTLPTTSTVQSVLSTLGAPSTTTAVSPPVPLPVPANVTPVTQTFTPATAVFPPPSRLEILYSQRAGQPLQQFGYDTFGVGTQVTITQVGNVQDSYVLGPGDQISVVLRGHDMSSYVVPVDRDGRIIVPNYQPVMAAGRTFGEVRADLADQIAHDALQTRAYISLAGSRQISVLVTGEVYAPGLRTMSGLNTPLDAILLSGGIRKTGSLRNVILERGGRRRIIDLYTVIGHGNPASLGNVTEGDHIIVSSLGPTAAVIGLVKRAGIYELPAGARSIGGQALVRLAGGFEIGGAMRLSKIGLLPSGRTELVVLGNDGAVENGEILSADQIEAAAIGRVTLVGAVQLPGTRALNDAPTLSRLFRDSGELTSDAYTQYGIVVHRDPRSNFRKPEAFSLKRVFEGAEDKKLASNDIVYVFTTAQVQSLAGSAFAQIQNNQQYANVPPSVLNQTAQSLSTVNLSMPSQAGWAPIATPTPPSITTPTTASSSTSSTSPTTGPSTGTPTTTPGVTTPPVLSGPQLAQMASSGLSPNQIASQVQSQISPSTTPALPTIGTGTPPSSTVTSSGTAPGASVPGAVPQPSASTQFPGSPTPATVDPRLQAAVNGAPAAMNPILQAQNATSQAQFAASGAQIQSNGLTSNAGLGAPPQDTSPTDIAAFLDITPAALFNLDSEYLVFVSGAVRDPGPYLAESGTSLEGVLDAAGGVQRSADLSWIEVTSTDIDVATGTSKTVRTAYKGNAAEFEKVSLRPLDSVRVRQVFSDRDSGFITIAGQVRYPGTFDITRGERISSILERAGGLTDEAYPYGAVFTRVSAAILEAEGNAREASELQAGIAAQTTNPNVNATAMTYLQTLVQTLQKQPALGRITVTADPAILSVKANLDMTLEPGDFIYIPKRPSTVAVSGEVLNPGAFQYKEGMSVDDYLQLAGGANDAAESSETFIIMPDGTARPASGGVFSFLSSQPIPPGATIVVPPDPAPFNTMVFLQNVSQVFSQLALGAASLAVVAKGQ
ncbi:MAG: SLBB domain-containing protein [Rhizomicrobium sp.]